MKTSLLLLTLAAAALLLVPGVAKAIGERFNEGLFALMQRSGLVLMAEQTSREAARIASSTYGYKVGAASSGPVRASVITGPTTVAWAQNDTCGKLDRIPAGSRILGALISCADMGTSITMDVGLRAWTIDGTGTAVDADGIVAALDVATAAVNAFNAGGALCADGASTSPQRTPNRTSRSPANPTDDADVRVTVLYVSP